MTFGEKLHKYLSENETVSNFVGDKIYPNKAPQTAVMPYIVCCLVSDIPMYTLDGNSHLSTRKVQISIHNENYVQACHMDAAISQAMDKWNEFDAEIQAVTKTNGVDGHNEKTQFCGKKLEFSIIS